MKSVANFGNLYSIYFLTHNEYPLNLQNVVQKQTRDLVQKHVNNYTPGEKSYYVYITQMERKISSNFQFMDKRSYSTSDLVMLQETVPSPCTPRGDQL